MSSYVTQAWADGDPTKPVSAARMLHIEAGIAAASTGGSALTHAVTQTAHGFSVGQAVRFNGTQYVLAKADTGANADVDGLVSAVADANDFTIQIGGYISGLSGLSAGSSYFLSPSSAGALTATEPSAAGQVSKPILHADSSSSGFLLNMRGLVIPAPFIKYLGGWLLLDATALTTGEDFAGVTWTVTPDMNGMTLVSPVFMVATASSSGLPSFGLRKNSTEMLSTNVTIDVSELTSATAATPAVIAGGGAATVATGDKIHFDCDAAGTGTTGCGVLLGFS